MARRIYSSGEIFSQYSSTHRTSLVFFFKYFNSLPSYLLGILFYMWGSLLLVTGLLINKNLGFVYQNGVSPSLWFLFIETGINIHKIFPAYDPKQMFSPLHFVWVIVLFVFWSYYIFKLSLKNK